MSRAAQYTERSAWTAHWYSFGKPVDADAPGRPARPGSEHNTTGISRGFPDGLARACRIPSLFQAATEAGHVVDDQKRSGGVFLSRPVSVAGEMFALFVRIQSLPEKGSRGGGRAFSQVNALAVPAEDWAPDLLQVAYHRLFETPLGEPQPGDTDAPRDPPALKMSRLVRYAMSGTKLPSMTRDDARRSPILLHGNYLGGFGAEGGGAIVTQKTFDVSGGDGPTTVTFDFYEIDSWDGENFNVYIDGVLVISEDFVGFGASSNDPNASGTTAGVAGGVSWTIEKQTDGLSSLGENASFNDQIWTVTLTLADPGTSFTLGFGSTLDQDNADEEWGVDNLSITRPDNNAVSIFEDFENGATGWSNNATVVDAGFTQYIQLNETSSQPVATEKTFDVSAGEGDVTIAFDLYEIDDVDLDTTEDRFIVFVDGAEIFSLDFDGTGNDAARSGTTGDVSWSVIPVTDGSTNIGNAASTDQIHRVVLTVANPGSDVTLGFGETFDFNEEFYGIDNLSITRAAPSSDAANDAITVGETEGSGDVDGNVLTNDANAVSVALVNGVAGNVGTSVAGTNGGFFTINSNGDVDFDAAGAFDSLNTGQQATTSVTYALDAAGVNSATLTVTIDGSSTPVDAVDDSSSLTESETSGDIDLQALANDTGDSIAVTSVEGDPANVGSAVAGDNGGLFTVNADGSVDFDANTDFEDLGVGESRVTTVDYTITSPEPFVEGSQTVESSGDVGPSDQTAFFTLTAQQLSNDGTTDISGSIDLSGITQPSYNILFVMDVSGSTVFTNPSFPGADDQNGDGDSNEVIDAEILSLRQLSDEIDGLGFSDQEVQIGLVFFDTVGSANSSTQIVLEAPGDQSFNAGSQALEDAINPGTNVQGGTDFEAALQFAIRWFENQEANGEARDNNIIYFLSDGEHNGGTFTDEVATLETNFDAQINGIGISSGANLTQLNALDNTGSIDPNDPINSTGTAQRVDTLADLDAALAPPFLDADIIDFRIFVDGVQDTSIDVNDLTQQGTGFIINPQALSGLTTNTNDQSTILAEVEFDDGTVLSNTLVVGTPSQDTATISVTVTGENDLPVAVDDSASGNEDTDITGNVLTNDSDVDGDPLTAALATGPSNGQVTVNPDGTFTYTPNQDFNGTDSFSYTLSDDEGGTETATVTLTVAAVNDAPEANDDTASTTESAPVSVNLLGNDTDVENDTLTIVSANAEPVGTPFLVTSDGGRTGTVTVEASGATQLTFTPNDGSGPSFEDLAVGVTDTVTVSYLVTDGNGGNDVATLTITVTGQNDVPIAQADFATGLEDNPITGNVLANDDDVDGDQLTAILDTGPTNGQLELNPNGTFTYTPDANFNGTDTFTYIVFDGNGGSDSQTVTLTVGGDNDVPVANPDTVVANEDEILTIPASVLTGNDTDEDGDTLTIISIDDALSTGNVTLDGTNVLYDPNDQFEDLAVGETATDTFTYTVSDGNGGTATTTVTVTIEGRNDLPTPQGDTATGEEDTPITGNVLTNDTDPDGDPLTASLGTPPANGTVVVQPNGDFTYTPDPDFNGTDTFTYVATDPNGGTTTETVTVTVDPVNDAPVAAPDAVTGDEDSPITGNVLDNDDDVDGDPLTATLGTPPANGTVVVEPNGDFTYTPDPDFNGTDTFTYVATDPSGETSVETVTVTVDPVNDDPVAEDDFFNGIEDTDITGNVLDNDDDVDGDTLTVLISNQPTNGDVTLDPDGSFTYTPDANFNGTDSFTYVVLDGNGGTDTATVTLTVGGDNDNPIANPDTATTDEDSALAIPAADLLTNDTDADGDTLSILSVSGAGTTGTVTLNGTDVVYDPDGEFEDLGVGETATDTFTYTVSDGNGGTATSTVTVTITGVNDAPVAAPDTAAGDEDSPITGNVLTNDQDPDGDTLLASLGTPPANGTVVVNPDGSFEYTPDPDFNGTDTFTYVATDPSGTTSVETVTVTVNPVNDAPVAVDDNITFPGESVSAVVEPLLNDTDVDGDTLTVQSFDGSGLQGTIRRLGPNTDELFYEAGGAFESLAVGETAIETFTYVVADPSGASDQATVTLTITGVNDGPTAVGDTATVGEDDTARPRST